MKRINIWGQSTSSEMEVDKVEIVLEIKLTGFNDQLNGELVRKREEINLFPLICHNQLDKWYYLSGNGEMKKVAYMRQGTRISY